MNLNRADAEKKLQILFGFPHFYDVQWQVIEKIFLGQRVLLIEKTGFGKSLCYQFPATQFSGTTVIFSPLIALMRDQVQKLQKLGLNAHCIHSNQSVEENQQIIQAAQNNQINILYIAPERMENAAWLQTARQMNLAMIVVDEAHCISVWGHDFRPAFRRIVNLVNLLPLHFPVLATTATATPRVEQDILQQIGRNMITVRGQLLRPNLRLRVVMVHSEAEKMIWLGENLEKIPGAGIIYTGTQTNTEIYTHWLNHLHLTTIAYHAGLTTETRKVIEKGLWENTFKCVVSTSALGMGIDKPDLRFIVHTQIPVSPIHYYQEIGRAGRDGKPSLIILFYNPDLDLTLPRSFIEGGRPAISKYERVLTAIKNDRLTLHALIKKVNLKQTQVRVILADLIDQGIILEVPEKRSKIYEYQFNAPPLNTQAFELLRQAKLQELAAMVQYTQLTDCRMRFLCNYLGNPTQPACGFCDNDTGRHVRVEVVDNWRIKFEHFQHNYFPVLEVQTTRTNLINGVAAGFYGFSQLGQILHRCKYENHADFPEALVELTVRAFHHHFKTEQFDLVLHVPATESGLLVQNFSHKVAQMLGIPISDNLIKIKPTRPQKIFQTNILKTDNVAHAFEYQNPAEIDGKKLLLIDDIFDSGATIKEIGKLLTRLNASVIAPLVIARTISGDLS
ncbi:RecQ family ATP-dependent DNA helicase [candidate division KSB1 bacterium]|nr:RecQ family ATP-dependent DNA helicase [candidate division KSB1 bacterium]